MAINIKNDGYNLKVIFRSIPANTSIGTFFKQFFSILFFRVYLIIIIVNQLFIKIEL